MYFIRDCNNKIVGNQKGYKTIHAALKQQNMKTSKAYAQIWYAFYNERAFDNTRISSVK